MIWLVLMECLKLTKYPNNVLQDINYTRKSHETPEFSTSFYKQNYRVLFRLPLEFGDRFE